MGTPLVIDDDVRVQIKACIEVAEASPVDMTTLLARLKDPVQKDRHMAQMTRQSVTIPLCYTATFSIEHGHPCGPCRHMSMSVQREGRAPNPAGIWMVAKEFGFWGNDVTACLAVWPEELQGHGTAINIVQPIAKPA